MRKILLLLLSFIVISLNFSSSAWALNEAITSFDSQITINQNTSITIQETIVHQTSIARHGIYRYIPTKIKTESETISTPVKIVSITDLKGDSYNYTTSYQGSNIVFKIGDPNKTYTGSKTYLVSYTVKNALKKFPEHHELYWDITGEGWKIPILQSSATISSPFANITKINCFSGKIGTNDKACTKTITNNQSAQFQYQTPVTNNSNFTVVLSLDKNGSLVFPSLLEKSYTAIIQRLLTLIISSPLILIFLLWLKKGRDKVFDSPNIFNNNPNQPYHLKPVFHRFRTPLVYQPLTHLTPAEAHAILTENIGLRAIPAEIIDLARKKYLKIKDLGKKHTFSSQTDYQLTKLKDKDRLLPKHQQYLLESIFESEDKIKLSELKKTFYKHVPLIFNKILMSLDNKNLFTKTKSTKNVNTNTNTIINGITLGKNSSLMKTRLKYMGITVAAIIITFVISIGIVTTFFIMPDIANILLLIITPIFSLAFAYNLIQKTPVGTNYMLQVKGLKATIKRGSWREKIHEKHLFIEETLPFAIALGVVGKLAKDMEKLNIKPPSYISSSMVTAGSLNSFVSSFSTNVASSTGTSSSGFSGGSSGGGGGGGGGGSW